MSTKRHCKTLQLLLFVSSSYLVTSTLAKYLHELGHASVAFILGVPISSMAILVNPFGSGYFRPTRFGFQITELQSILFTVAGAAVPIVVLLLLYILASRRGTMTRWLVGMLFGYSLLSNAVNLVSGAFTRLSDGGYLVSLGLPVPWLVAISASMGAVGAIVLIRENFIPIIRSVKGLFQSALVSSGFLISAVMGLVLVEMLGDSIRRRLFFSSFEALLVVFLLVIALLIVRNQGGSKEQDRIDNIPKTTWMILLVGSILSGASLAMYALSEITKS